MKDINLVQSLIAQLKEQATNNFELHRIEVLERDLFNPQKNKQVDEDISMQTAYRYYFGEVPDILTR